jgi:hypothetical protein
MSSKQITEFITDFKEYFRPLLISDLQKKYIYQYRKRYRGKHNNSEPPPEIENIFIRDLIDTQKPIHEAEKILEDFEKKILKISKFNRFYLIFHSAITVIVVESLIRYIVIIFDMYRTKQDVFILDSLNFIPSIIAIIALIVSFVISEKKDKFG